MPRRAATSDSESEWAGSESDEVAPAAKRQKATSAAPARKTSKKPEADPQATAAAAKLQRAALAANLVHSDREPAYEYSLLHPSKELRQMASKSSVDVVRSKGPAAKKKCKLARQHSRRSRATARARTRRPQAKVRRNACRRYLMMLPGRFAPVEGGTIGTIEKLDTPNPELLLHWPSKARPCHCRPSGR